MNAFSPSSLKHAAAAALCAALLGNSPAQAANYGLEILPALNGKSCAPLGLNNVGQVVGQCDGHAVVWNNGQITDLTPDLQGDYNEDAAYGINDKGEIVYSHLFELMLLKDGAPIALKGAQGGLAACPCAINEKGKVTGSAIKKPDAVQLGQVNRWSIDAAGQQHATELAIIATDTTSEAHAINKHGVVVGVVGLRAVSWHDKQGGPLEADDGRWSRANGINASGTVVGVKQGASNDMPVKWEGGQAIALPLLTTKFTPGGWALGINDKGDIVGHATLQGLRAVVWRKDKVLDLNDLLSASAKAMGWTLVSAVAINHSGVIVGTAVSPATSSVTRAFVFTPPRKAD
ncbi:MAG TPA: hypothetical protein VLA61_12715 [Ideonella sp.]|uniref:hypothetical protein n=1 Tax=Ideonella sp. TaxID=1929293 RepID=UPI002BE1505E|nr:hypothetical protein [Ideonella sp.]HSI49126.1 hypothetical protein [Ideonella sp.]